MAHEIRSISQVGTSEPFELQVARGQIPGHHFRHILGEVPAMSQNQSGTIWDVNDTNYPWSAFAAAGTLSVARASTSDADKKVIIYGLDADYNEIVDEVVLAAASGNVTTKSFIRIHSARMNGTSTNVGAITITKGGTTVARILAGVGNTLMAIYTVPAGYTAYLTQGVMTIQNGGDATGTFYYRVPGDRFIIGHRFEVASSEYHYAFTCPFAVPAKSDLDVRASVRTNNSIVTAAFDLILIQNTGPL